MGIDLNTINASVHSIAISDGTTSLVVNLDGSINSVVTATDLDIRDLSHTQDSVKIGDGTDFALVTAAGELNVLASAQPGVDIGDVTVNNASGAAAVNIQDGGNSITVDANNLDIRDLAFATDSVTAYQGGTWTIMNTMDAFSTWKSSNQTVTGTASQLAAVAFTSRDSMIIQNRGDKSIFLGPANTVTTANGLEIPAKSSQEIGLQDDATIWAIAASGSQDIRIAEYSY